MAKQSKKSILDASEKISKILFDFSKSDATAVMINIKDKKGRQRFDVP